jgi:uncharacterized membrane protein YvlD (DUF360 family)
MLSVLIGVLIICVVGAICFWVIEKFVNDSRLANLLKLLVVLVCVGAILQRVLSLAGINWFWLRLTAMAPILINSFVRPDSISAIGTRPQRQ